MLREHNTHHKQQMHIALKVMRHKGPFHSIWRNKQRWSSSQGTEALVGQTKRALIYF